MNSSRPVLSLTAALLLGCSSSGVGGGSLPDGGASAPGFGGFGSQSGPGTGAAPGTGTGATPGFGGLGNFGSGGSPTGGTGATAPGGGGSVATGGSGGSVQTCSGWPSGPSGVTQGKTLPSHLAWQGYAAGQSSPSSVSVQDLYDCNGTRSVNAILFISASTSCGICKSEASKLESKMQYWKTLGIQVVTLMLSPKSVEAAKSWKDAYGLHSSAVVSDPNYSMAYTTTVGTPLHTVVDPRNMQVVMTQMGGGSGFYSALESLAQQNKQGGGGTGGSPGTGGMTGTGGSTGGPSCAGYCGTDTQVGGSCYCDSQCIQYGDCCPDYGQIC